MAARVEEEEGREVERRGGRSEVLAREGDKEEDEEVEGASEVADDIPELVNESIQGHNNSIEKLDVEKNCRRLYLSLKIISIYAYLHILNTF